jgi:Cu-Zn family superoxide dismutase
MCGTSAASFHFAVKREKTMDLFKIATTSMILALCPVASSSAETVSAQADLVDREGNSVGQVIIDDTASGFLHVRAALANMPSGTHAFHIHSKGVCAQEAGFSSAQGHLAGDMEHGFESEGGPHPGDFPNIHVPASGQLTVEFVNDRLSLSSKDGKSALFDQDGAAILIHASADDYESQPAGAAGRRIACGELEKVDN